MLKRYLLNKGFKKRYVVFGLLAFELASLPAAAQIISKAIFPEKAEPKLSASLIQSTQNQQTYLISSNTEFYITADIAHLNYHVSIQQSGELKGEIFVQSSQMPGAALFCSRPTEEGQVIYPSLRGTMVKPEKKLDDTAGLKEAVLFKIRYNGNTLPQIKFMTGPAELSSVNRHNCSV
ncbi:hypothetical protein DES40_0531 [Litorimonas taeanensis]|uniref:Uncharacterized protein n=1 Tax=Litorimonas taeanensis TaxID=568099 RepID=A0A420WJN7_9PROT|nr:hypothetical protein [Litorimonas taeanensis]RKQ71218.1 hypothetical protein DES40_0531 [Litorimonas taeanensis]